MRDQRIFLKIKLKSLAAEARIIKHQEKKSKYWNFQLYHHRITVVRREARHTHLAYAFLRGRSYSQIEEKCHTPPDWEQVRRMVTRYGVRWNADEPREQFQDRLTEQSERFDKWNLT
ncbi:MAG: hypothetical protein ACE5KG_05145 [Nitrososphaerales archaeon]